jgi:hypothetical protein
MRYVRWRSSSGCVQREQTDSRSRMVACASPAPESRCTTFGWRGFVRASKSRTYPRGVPACPAPVVCHPARRTAGSPPSNDRMFNRVLGEIPPGLHGQPGASGRILCYCRILIPLDVAFRHADLLLVKRWPLRANTKQTGARREEGIRPNATQPMCCTSGRSWRRATAENDRSVSMTLVPRAGPRGVSRRISGVWRPSPSARTRIGSPDIGLERGDLERPLDTFGWAGPSWKAATTPRERFITALRRGASRRCNLRAGRVETPTAGRHTPFT